MPGERPPGTVPDVLVVTRGHAFDRNAFAEMLDSFDRVTCTQVEHPAAQQHFSPDQASRWHAYLMYDMPGYERPADKSYMRAVQPPEEFRSAFLATVEQGHGIVFLHHALAAWPAWPEYADVMGGSFRFLREKDRPDSGYRHAVRQQITPAPAAAGHPILAGLEQGFEIEDEVYLAAIAEGVRPLLVTDVELTDRSVYSAWNAVKGDRDSNEGWTHPTGSGVVAWIREHPTSRIVYLQFGDGPSAFANPAFRRLLHNALCWAAEGAQAP